MIEQAALAYEQNELIHKIRSEHGLRKASEGASNLGASLQDELRSSEREGRPTSGTSLEGSPRDSGYAGGSEVNQRTPKGRNSREGRPDPAAYEGDGGSDSHINSIGRAFQFKQTNGGIDEKKPSGLYTKPNVKERQARGEQIEQGDGSPSQAQSKKNFFVWLRSADNGKAKQAKPSKPKGRPLTEKEIEELKPDLMEALQEALPILDQVILATNKAHSKPYIFGSFDDEDIEKMANWWLKKARKSEQMAQAARQLISYHDDVEILVMVVPTIKQTIDFYRDNGGFSLRGR